MNVPEADLKQGKGEVACSSPLESSWICSSSYDPETSEKKHRLANSSYLGLHMITLFSEFQQHMVLSICQECIILHLKQITMPA